MAMISGLRPLSPLWCLRHHLSPKGKHVTGFSGHYVPLQIQFLCHPAVRGHNNPQGSNGLTSIPRYSAAKTSPSGWQDRPLSYDYCDARGKILPPSPFPANKKRTPEGVLFFIP